MRYIKKSLKLIIENNIKFNEHNYKIFFINLTFYQMLLKGHPYLTV